MCFYCLTKYDILDRPVCFDETIGLPSIHHSLRFWIKGPTRCESATGIEIVILVLASTTLKFPFFGFNNV